MIDQQQDRRARLTELLEQLGSSIRTQREISGEAELRDELMMMLGEKELESE